MKKKISMLLALLTLGFASWAEASSYMGYVQSVAQINGRVFIFVGGGWFGADNCGSGRSNLIVYADTTTVEGRSFVALATASKLSGNQVYVAGNSDCYTGNTPNGGTSESVSVMWLQ